MLLPPLSFDSGGFGKFGKFGFGAHVKTASRIASYWYLGPVAGRGVGSGDCRSADVGGRPASTGPRHEATVQRDAATEERELVGVAHEYTDTCNIYTNTS